MIATRGNFCILSLNTRLLIKAGKRDETKIYSGVIARNLATPSATDLLSWEAKSSKNKAWPKDFMTSTNNQVSKISQQTSTNIFECTTALPLIRQAKFITASYLTDPHLLQLGQFFAVAFCSEKKNKFQFNERTFFPSAPTNTVVLCVEHIGIFSIFWLRRRKYTRWLEFAKTILEKF